VVEGWLERAARARPGHAALESGGARITYAELRAAARAGARALARRGVGRGQEVAIAMAPGAGFATAVHACLLAGAVAVPVDPRLSQAERRRVAAGAALVLEEPLSDTPPGEEPLAVHDLDAVAVVIHTSGTTALPRPVRLTYGNLLWSALGSAVALATGPQERWLCALPLSHVGGLSILIRSAIHASTAVLHERFDTERVVHALRGERITTVSLVATTLARLLEAGLREPPTLRCALTGGGPVPAALLTRAREAGVPVSQTYGLTEACSQVSTVPIRAADRSEGGARGAGPPLFCTRVRIDTDGEILVAGPTVAPAAASATDGWLHTGDLGLLDERGSLRVTGRRAETIVSGGENVAPAEVEAALEEHPGVLESAVVGRADPEWGEAVTAIVVASPGARLDEAQLRAHCAARLARYKVPKQVVLTVEPLPRTPSGKLLRRELRHRCHNYL